MSPKKPTQKPARGTTGTVFGRGARAMLAVLAVASTAPPRAARAQTHLADAGVPAGMPTFRDILSLRSVAGPAINGDGTWVAYVVSVPTWQEDRSTQELWVSGIGDAPRRVATEEDGFRGRFQWTPDGRWLAFQSTGVERPSLTLLAPDRGRSRVVDLAVGDVSEVRFSPDGRRVAFLASDPESVRDRREQELFGPFSFRDENPERSHIWVGRADGPGEPRRLTAGDFTVVDLAWSPDGSEIAFVRQPDSGRNSWWKADIYVVDVASGRIRALVSEAGPDSRPLWSPDGRSLAFLTTLTDSITNLPKKLAVVPARGGTPRVLTGDLPTEPDPVAWTESGIFLTALQGVENHLFRLDPEQGRLERLSRAPYLLDQASVSDDGNVVAFAAHRPDRLGEIYRSNTAAFDPVRLTDMMAQVDGWSIGTREVVNWIGPGGVRIEGILHKPTDFDPARRYPLLVVVHGGPRDVSTPALQVRTGVYPIAHFVRKGALVLEPNYRGSVGYGGAFRQLHRRGLGWGDAGDVEAGVAHLIREGLVDADRVGVMGWSYGGFISAYLSATSKAFKAVSVGAGISDWRTHYAWEPASYTTRLYSFGAAPWEDPNAYAVASPITYINNASTPTLIQHVDGDPVVTVLNAYELQHALQDLGVENRLVIYPGRGHGIGTLRQRLGALWHNWQWFLRHLWDEAVELPVGEAEPDPMGGSHGKQ